jgi:hypothetical protein
VSVMSDGIQGWKQAGQQVGYPEAGEKKDD